MYQLHENMLPNESDTRFYISFQLIGTYFVNTSRKIKKTISFAYIYEHVFALIMELFAE